MPNLECSHLTTCLPDYFQGCNLPYLSVPVYRNMELSTLKTSLESELQSCVQGVDEDTLTDAWYEAAKEAISEITVNNQEGYCFSHLDKNCDDVCAYFCFKREM